MLFGFYHLHKRIRERKKRAEEHYHPHFSLKKFIMDEIVYLAAIASPIMTIPQVLIIYQNRTADGVSLISWVSYMGISMIWIYYGNIHKEKPIIVSNMGWMVLSSLIILGIFIYR